MPVLFSVLVGLLSLLLVVLAPTWPVSLFGILVFMMAPIGLYISMRNSYGRAMSAIAHAIETDGPQAIDSVLSSSQIADLPEAKIFVEATAVWAKKWESTRQHDTEMHEKLTISEAHSSDLASTLSSFIYYTSHTLRTPLNSIRWLVEMFKNEELGRVSKKQRAALDKLEHTTVDLVNIASRLQDTLLVMRGDKLRMKLVTVDLRDIVDVVIGQWSIEARHKDLQIEWFIPTDGNYKVKVDVDRIKDTVGALIENAVRYSMGPNTISIHLCHNNNENLVLSIEDRGIGIKPDDVSRIFQPFFRGEKARLMWVDGTGINLMVAYAVINELGGDIKFDSIPSKKTTFCLYLPAVK